MGMGQTLVSSRGRLGNSAIPLLPGPVPRKADQRGLRPSVPSQHFGNSTGQDCGPFPMGKQESDGHTSGCSNPHQWEGRRVAGLTPDHLGC